MRRELIPLYFTAFFAYFAYMIVPPILPLYAEQLGANLIEISILFSSFFLTYLLFTVIWGSLSDTLRKRRPFLMGGLFASGFILIGFYFSKNVYELIGLSLIRGIAVGAFTPIALAIASNLNGEKRGSGMGIMNAALSSGWFVGALASGFLVELFSITFPFIAAAFITFLAAIIVIFVFSDFKALETQVNPSNEPANLRKVVNDLKRRFTVMFKKDEFVRKRGLSTVYVTLILRHGGLLGLYSLFPLYVVAVGGTPAQVGLLYALNMGTQAIFMWTMGLCCDRIGRKPVMIMGLAASGISAVWFGLSTTPVALIPSQVLVAFGYASVMVSATTIVADVAPRENRGEGMGLIMTSLGIGATIGPLIAGFLAELFGLATMMALMAILPLAGLLLFSIRMKETVDFKIDDGEATLY